MLTESGVASQVCAPATDQPTQPGSPDILISRSPSPRPSPVGKSRNWNGIRSLLEYDASASIALIGMRGAGTSTLAVIASSALGFRLLDADQFFYKATGLSRAAYKSSHGLAEYRREELRLLRSMLFDNPTGAVIVCGPGAVEGTGKEWLVEFSKDHPIIYIMRDADEIRHHLRVWDVEAIGNLIRRVGPAYRSLSTFEFYNILDTPLHDPELVSLSGDQSPKSLVLKNIEEDFLHLVYGITRRNDQYYKYQAHHALSSLPLESRNFTYALNLPLSTLETLGPKLRGVDLEADAIELTIPMSTLCQEGAVFDDTILDRISRQVYLTKRNIRLPMLYNIALDTVSSRQNDSTTAISDQDTYFRLLHHGLRLAPEYICVDLRFGEERIRQLTNLKGHTKILGHYTVTKAEKNGWNSPKRFELVRRAERLRCDIVRICQEATSMADNFAAQHFIHQVKASQEYTIPVIAYNTGDLGRMSCYLNSTLCPVTHPLVRSTAPTCAAKSLLTVQEAQKALFSSWILDKQYFGIYGNNVSQSLSPAMHNAAFKLFGMPHRYDIFLHDSLNGLRELIKDPDFGGASITAPFKSDVIPMLDFMSDEAKAIGAVNTLLCLKSPSIDSLLNRNRSGPTMTLFGENTDWIGIHTCIRRNLSPINAVRRRTTGLILGAGGMARAAAYALIRLGVKHIFVQNRSRHRAVELVKQFYGRSFNGNCEEGGTELEQSNGSSESPDHILPPIFRVVNSKEEPWPEDASPPTIVVSCVATRDLDGQCSVNTSIPQHWLSSPTGGVVVELSYTPLETPLLQQVRRLSDEGWIAVDGLQVLPEQAMMQFEQFTTRRAPARLMRREVFQAYNKRMGQAATILEMPT
ncbi:type I 3-dehydroquinase-domain-containing protein [Dactylonectria macrodidyma]|uniref:Type I 3-dehydroquinase-domain-containing protein n=1 Tax=Dactylonectria macrodidyma TaxID=307937 RepID=A0A9P9JND5_9HYPO|nr:type I 3-dehydroquinase-domain-containing protein [Dactylonectria macrodidyma]